MTEPTRHKISYCTTCKGRLHHLKQTLKANLATEAGNPNVEFVLLDYDSRDGLQDWVREHFKAELESGRLRYGRFAPAEHFHFAHAKNLAHRLASGDILCNLDADNFLAPGFSQWLDEQFTRDPHSVVTPQLITKGDLVGQTFQRLAFKQRAPTHGLAGRLALHRDGFEQLGGYDERIEGWGGDDLNLALRARDAGMRCVLTPPRLYGDVVRHGADERIGQLSPEAQAASTAKLIKPNKIVRVIRTVYHRSQRLEPVANGGMYGAGEIMPMEMPPRVHDLRGEAEPKRRHWRTTLPTTEPEVYSQR